MADKHFAPKNISGKRIEDFDFGEFISGKDHEKYYQRSPFFADREFCRTYSNHDEKCYNRTQKDIRLQKQDNRSMFYRSNSGKQFSNARTSLQNDWCWDCGTIQEKLSSKDACVQVSIGDMQICKNISEYNLYGLQGNINFEEKEELINGTCKDCQKPLSASDFEYESTSVNDPLKLVEDYGNHYTDIKSIPKYAHTCCYVHPENPYEGTNRGISKVNEYLPHFHSSRLQLEYLCPERCPSCVLCVPACYHDECSSEVCCPTEIVNNPYHLQYSLRSYDRNESIDDKRHHPHRSKAVLNNNFQCYCGKSVENRDNRHNFEPICDLHLIPESPLSLPNGFNSFHKISDAKCYMEYSKVSDYRTPPKNNSRKHVFLDKSRDNMQTSCDFNFCLDSEQAVWKSSSNCSSSCKVKRRSDGITTQPNCHKETSSDMTNNMHSFYTSEDTQKEDPKKPKSIDIRTPLSVQNINPVTKFRSIEKEIPNNMASNNSVKSPTQSQKNQQLPSARIQQNVTDAFDSNLSEHKDNGNDTHLNKSGSHEKMVEEKSNLSVQRASNVNAQRRCRNPESMADIYNNNTDNIMEEMKRVLIQKGKWNGK